MKINFIEKSEIRTLLPNKDVIGTSDISEYIPIYANFENEKITLGDSQNCKFVKLFNKINIFDNDLYCTSSYTSFLLSFKYKIQSIIYKFYKNKQPYCINANYHYISDNKDNILLVLCYKGEIIKNNIDSSNVRLYISTLFLKEEKYKNFYKKLYDDYIFNYINSDAEVVFTTSKNIEKKVYKNNFNIEFKTIDELSKILKNVGENYFYDVGKHKRLFENKKYS